MNIIIEELEISCDIRGIVFEPLNNKDIINQKNIHIVITKPGFIRGNHYHKKGIERLVIFGPALIRFKEKDKIKDTSVSEKKAIRLTIPPGISHAIKNIGKKCNILIAFNTEKHKMNNPDVFPDKLIDND